MMMQETGDEEGLRKAAGQLRADKDRYRDFCKETGLGAHMENTQVYGYDRSKSMKTVWSEKKGLTGGDNGDIISKAITNNVDTNGMRNETPLNDRQIKDCFDYAKELGFRENIAYSQYSNTAFVCSSEGERYCRLVIGTDVYPNPNSKTANGRLSYKAAIAHEVIGHYEAWKGGFSLDGVLEEAQASIRAGKFAPGLTDSDRILLYRDALTRLKNAGIKLNDVRKYMRVDRR